MTTDEPALDFTRAPEPPWVREPGEEPWWGGWRQGNAEPWYLYVFLPFWGPLDVARRQQYLAHWPPPSEDWAQHLTEYPIGALQLNVHWPPPPPWDECPGHGPRWLGWRFGARRAWLQWTFVPYWHAASEAERAAYLRDHPLPDPAWKKRLGQWAEGR